MDFGFSEEQELLRAEVRKFLDERCPIAEVRKLAETPEGFSRELWKRVAELGWLGLTIPEEYGGAGLGFVDWVVLLEETGRALFPSPLVSSALAAAAIRTAGSPEQRARWLPRLANGGAIAAAGAARGERSSGARGHRAARPARGRRLRALGREALRRATRARRISSSSRSGAASAARPSPSPSSSAARRASRRRISPAST